MALFWLRTSYHAQRYMFQRYMLRSLLRQSFNIVNTPVILLLSKKWVLGLIGLSTWAISAAMKKYSIRKSLILHYESNNHSEVHPLSFI